MKRLLASTVLVLLAVGGLTACSDGGDDAVVTVNGEEVLTEDELDDLLVEVSESDDLLAAQGARGTGRDTIRRTWVTSSVLYYVVQSELLGQELDDEGIELDDDATAAGEVVVDSILANPTDGTQPVTADQLPDGLLELYRTYGARYSARVEAFGADLDEIIEFDPATTVFTDETVAALEQANDHLAELRATADVEIAPAWGRWVEDDQGFSVAPPEGVGTTTTTLLVPEG
ncbi:MAG TPA: hypothetical protein VD926_08080 [Acidimicrobiales bacterium]|nr:hypothetical protein [Acidimicrobiales bacterium]